MLYKGAKMSDYATVTDIITLKRNLTSEEQARAQNLIPVICSVIRLKGKEVGEFIQKKRHYIISSEIRKKLGLGEHDTNIGIWLRDLLAQTEAPSR